MDLPNATGGAFKYDPFSNFFDWLKHNQTKWCVTAASFYETMLEGPGICPGTIIHPTFCADFVDSYETQCNENRDVAVTNKLLLSVFAVALGCALFAGWTTRRTEIIPESGVCIIVGLAAGTLLYTTANKENNNAASAAFDPSIFFLVLIPPIALNALLEIDPYHFNRNLPSIMWLAGMQTVFSCLTVGFILNARFSDFGMPACLLIGAISSAVDPTALRESLARRRCLLLERLSLLFSGPRKGNEDEDRFSGPERDSLIRSLKVRIQQLGDLDATIFGESTLNDGISFVLYTSILPLVTGSPRKESSLTPSGSPSAAKSLDVTSPSSVTPLERTAGECITEFFRIYGQSFLIGLLSGLFSALLFKCFARRCGLRSSKLRSSLDEASKSNVSLVSDLSEPLMEESEEKLATLNEGTETSSLVKHPKGRVGEYDSAGIRGVVVFIALALVPYYLCELYELSGLVGLVSSTFFMSSFTMHSMTPQQRKDARKVVGTLSKLTEMFVFSYTGFCISAPFAPADIAIEDVKFKWDVTFVLWVVGANLAGRLWIFVLGGFANLLRRPGLRYEFRDLFVLFWSSLRGPVCFALGMGIPRYNHVTQYGSKEAPVIAASLTALVVGTVFLFGGTSGFVIERLYSSERGVGVKSHDMVEESLDINEGHDEGALSRERPRGQKSPTWCFWRQATKFRQSLGSLHNVMFRALVVAPDV